MEEDYIRIVDYLFSIEHFLSTATVVDVSVNVDPVLVRPCQRALKKAVLTKHGFPKTFFRNAIFIHKKSERAVFIYVFEMSAFHGTQGLRLRLG
jgi:hypothetical protein